MKLVTAQPTTGQFVAVWEYDGEMWSDTYRWDNGDLFMFDAEEDVWVHQPYGLKIACTHKHLWHYVVK